MEVKIQKDWKVLLKDEFEKEYFHKLVKFLKSEYRNKTIYPKGENIFNAFEFTPPQDVKVVILGQDPYHGVNQAHGLSFSVPEGIAIPPSLRNIYKEIKDDLNKEIPTTGNLENWAKQGVLLLNATLTVEASKAGSHQNKGWETFTDAVIKQLSENYKNIVFMLWGNYAKNKGQIITTENHLILQVAHPSPFAAHRGFFGCKHFSKANDYLKTKNKSPINW